MALPKPNLTSEQLKARSAMWVKRWRDKYPEKQALARKKSYLNRKIKAMDKVGGAVCKLCGCNELSFLEFNHKNGGGAKEIRENGYGSMMDMILTKKRKVDDLEVLCRVCNALDHLQRKNKLQANKFMIKWDTL